MQKVIAILLMNLILGGGLAQAQITTPADFEGRDADLWDNFLEANQLCDLPCFWGFHVGETSFTEVLTFITENDFGRYKNRTYYAGVSLEEYLGWEILAFDFTGRTDDITRTDFSFNFQFDDENILVHIGISYSPYYWMPAYADAFAMPNLFSHINELPLIYEQVGGMRYADEFQYVIDYPNIGISAWYWCEIDNFIRGTTMPYELCFGQGNARYIAISIGSTPIDPNRYDDSDVFASVGKAWQTYGLFADEMVSYFRDNPGGCYDMAARRLLYPVRRVTH